MTPGFLPCLFTSLIIDHVNHRVKLILTATISPVNTNPTPPPELIRHQSNVHRDHQPCSLGPTNAVPESFYQFADHIYNDEPVAKLNHENDKQIHLSVLLGPTNEYPPD